jgi:SAM-dependent methyltransferase
VSSAGVFSSGYADAYDALYQDKDYDAEVGVVERVFQTYADGSVKRVLDLGCGTGGHSVVLAERGYEVVGVDRSESMLARAEARGSRARFEVGDLATLELAETFDAVLLMFAVLGYQVGNSDVAAALQTARRHLRPGGVLFLDAWYGPAVLAERPSDRVKVVGDGESQVLRSVSSELDARHHVCLVHYHVWRLEQGRLVSETREHHTMRYFFPLELELFLDMAGFEPRRLGGFPDLEAEPGQSSWNVGVVAVAR